MLAVAAGWVVLARGDVGAAVRYVSGNPLALVTFLAAVYGAYRSTG